MADLSQTVKAEMLRFGADVVGFGDLLGLPDGVRGGLPVGISIAVVYPKDVIRGIADLPTLEYYEWYERLNVKLDAAVSKGASMLADMGYKAVALTREYVSAGTVGNNSLLPHKTVATRAGIGWIGKCALLVTEGYGSALRISSILTDAPLSTAMPIDRSRCGDCTECTNACPAGAVSGKLWDVNVYRDEFFDPLKCRATARERSKKGFGGENVTICGKCIEICPYTRRYLTD